MRTHVVRALADVVATKLGIILLSFFFLSSSILPLTFLPEGFAYDFFFFLSFSSFLPRTFLPEGVYLGS